MRRTGAELAAVLFGLFFLAGCGGGGGDGRSNGAGAPADNVLPKVVSMNAPGGSTLGAKASLVITFSEPMQPQTLILGGVMAPESDGGVWSSAAAKPGDQIHTASGIGTDRLTLRPKTVWSAGVNRTLSIDVQDLAGNRIDTIHLTYTIDDALPTVSAGPQDASPLAKGEAITLVFTKSMSASSLTLGGDLGAQAAAGVWSTTNQADDTVTISPTASWSLGPQTLTVGGTDLLGNAMAPATLHYDVVAGMIHVSLSGDDANDGTKENPKKSIPGAIATAVNQHLHPGAVLVSEGTYLVDSGANPPTQVIVTEGISLYGGYATDFSRRDPNSHNTTLQDLSTKNTGSSNPNRAIEAGSGVTAATVVDGFTIQGGEGSYSSGVFNHNGGAPTIRNNVIDGGRGSAGSIGIQNNGSAPLIQNNTITGGSGGAASYGIANASAGPSIQNNIIHGGAGIDSYGISNINTAFPLIENNTIDGGDGSNNSYGIYNFSSLPKIRSNTIDGGRGSNSSLGIYNTATLASLLIQSNIITGGRGNTAVGVYNIAASSPLIEKNMIDGGGGSASYGIYSSSSAPEIRNNTISGGIGSNASQGIFNNGSSNGLSPAIRNNTINGGAGAISTGIMSQSASPTIENNIVFTSGDGTRSCMVEITSNADPASLRNNDLFDCPDALYLDEGITKLTSIDDVNALADTTAGGNISVNPAFVSKNGPDDDVNTMADNDWHLSSASPAAVTDGGLDLSSDFTVDKDDITRTLPWSIGAYQLK